ncbi:AsmA-like C-terminal region-containing protein [Cecembia sp.]|uniref:AsmA-like C-terminal region-containing protein n=1 Tax=Cecembia sp. TaxID=1898110 RepID=UPI0025BA8615|nr:AsmA-like C-terminal region-containing protein [Cecembia sp.]
MKPWIKNSLIIIFFLPIVLIGATVAILVFKQEAITQKAISAANSQFVGKLTVENSRVSILSDFPYISIDLRGVAFFENKAKDTRPFYEAGHLYLGFNIWDIIEGNYKVKSISISDGHADLVKYPNGDINILLAKGIESGTREEEGEMVGFELAKVKISNFIISFEDKSDTMSYKVEVDEWKSSIRKREGNFAFDLKGNLIFDLLRHGKPTFFSEKNIHMDLDLNFDVQQQVLQLMPSKIGLEEALFAANGKVDILEKGVEMDLRLEGQKPDFNMFGAFLPKGVADALNEYQNEGEVFFKGTVRGLLAEGSTPAIAVEFGCENAFFQRADNNLKVDELRFFGFFTNGSERNLRTSELQVQNFNARPEQGIFQGDLTIRNFEDPYVKVKLKADLDMEFVGDFFQLEKFEGISGQVLLSMDFDELVDLDASATDLAQLKQSIQSELVLRNLNFTVADFPYPISNVNADAIMQEGAFNLRNLNFRISNSDFDFKGQVSDLPAIFHRFDKQVKVSMEANSKKMDLAQLFNKEDKKEKIHEFNTRFVLNTKAAELFDFQYLPKGNLVLEKFQARLENYPHKFEKFKGELTIGEKELAVKNFSGQIDQSDFRMDATVYNYPKWFQEELAGNSSIDWSLQSSKLKVNDLLTYNGVNYLPESWVEEVFSALDLRGKLHLYFDEGLHGIDLILDQLTGRTQLHPLKLEQFKGKVNWERDYLSIKDFGGKMGQSEFAFDLGLNLNDSLQTKKDYFHLRAAALDLDALLGFKGFEVDTNHAEAFNIFKIPFRDMEFTADIKKLNYHYNWLEDVKGKARTTSNHFLHLDTLGLRVVQGSLGMKGYLNGSNPEEIYLHAQMRAEKLNIDKLLFKIENAGKDIMINENLKGEISGTIEGRFLVYPDLTPIIDQSDAKIALTVYDGSLVNFAPFLALSDFFSDRNLNRVRFDTLTNTFELKEGVLHIPRMNINSSLGFLEIAGRQSLDLDMNYEIRVPLSLVSQVGFRRLFGNRSRNEIDPEQEDAIVFRDNNRRVRFLNINMQGRPDDFRVSLGRMR